METRDANKGKKRKKTALFSILPGMALFLFLVATKKLCINPLIAVAYPVQGVDVSHYQGDIDWENLAGQDIDFAYIKATEGSRHVDEKFQENWTAAGQTELWLGAYHFFSFDSDAKSQAALFMDTVGDLSGKLAPVVDVEYYGDKRTHLPDRGQVVGQLREFLEILEGQYGVKPVIYTTRPVYGRYIKKEFDQYPLWIRNVYFPPDLEMGGRWEFWQYSDTAVMDGYSGDEKYIDRNVFLGGREKIEDFLVPNICEIKAAADRKEERAEDGWKK